MTPYVPHTVWVSTTPRPWRPREPQPERRAYKQGGLSWVATQVLEYIKLYPGAKATDVRTALDIASISRQLKCLDKDGLIKITFHKNIAGKPLMRCWPNDPATSTQPLEPHRHEEDYLHRQTTTSP